MARTKYVPTNKKQNDYVKAKSPLVECSIAKEYRYDYNIVGRPINGSAVEFLAPFYALASILLA